jgi:hypothetical protein
MADISKCSDHLCPSKEICYRFTAPVDEFRQSWINTNRESDAYNCDLFWHNGTCKYCGQKEGVHKMSCETHKQQINLSQQDKP